MEGWTLYGDLQPKSKWVNSILNIFRLNSLRLRGLYNSNLNDQTKIPQLTLDIDWKPPRKSGLTPITIETLEWLHSAWFSPHFSLEVSNYSCILYWLRHFLGKKFCILFRNFKFFLHKTMYNFKLYFLKMFKITK